MKAPDSAPTTKATRMGAAAMPMMATSSCNVLSKTATRSPTSSSIWPNTTRQQPSAPLHEQTKPQPAASDPRAALVSGNAQIVEEAMWIWPFSPGLDYLVAVTVARSKATTW
jgi:hypothetical protein